MEGITMSYKTILVHVDSSKRCAVRVEFAIRLARQHDAHLVALHAIAPFEPPGYVMAEMGASITRHAKRAAAAAMARAESEFSAQASAAAYNNVEWRRAIEDPVEAMTLHARYADLVVVGQTDNADVSLMAADFP